MSIRNAHLPALTLAVALAGAAVPARAHDSGQEVRGPADAYVYSLAAPGSYALPVIEPAADGALLDEAGGRRRLHDLLAGRLTVMAFIYTRCGEICPVATMRLAELRDMAAADPEVGPRLRLLSVSFDPQYDTPAVMAEYARHWRGDEPGAPEWLFLTAADEASQRPVLEAYDQPVGAKPAGDAASGPLTHLLRVFLIDEDRRIRNIYSSDFLDPRLVMNDLRTLIGARAGAAAR